MRVLVLGLVGAILVGGCVTAPEGGPSAPGAPPPAVPAAPQAPVVAIPDCSCWEPALAVDAQDRIFVVLSGEPRLAMSADGGRTFEERIHPPLPEGAPPGSTPLDGYIQAAPDGSLYYINFLSPPFAGLPLGMQVARSTDGAASWGTNVLLGLTGDPQPGVVSPWKSWIAFGPDGAVYVAYNQRGGLVMVGRSEDQGRTFAPFVAINQPGDRAVSNFPAQPVVLDDGRVLVAYFGDQSPQNPTGNPFVFKGHALKVGISDDRGATWRTVVAASAAPPAWVGSFFPALARDAPGTLALAWWSHDAAVRVATSEDRGETWGEPAVWSGTNATIVGPWADAREGRLTVLYHEEADEGYRLATASGPLGAAEPAARGVAAEGTGVTGDFAHFARLADGRIVLAWAEEGSLRVATVQA